VIAAGWNGICTSLWRIRKLNLRNTADKLAIIFSVLALMLLISGISHLSLSPGASLDESVSLSLERESFQGDAYQWMVPLKEPEYLFIPLSVFLLLLLVPAFRIFFRDTIVIILAAAIMGFFIYQSFTLVFEYLDENPGYRQGTENMTADKVVATSDEPAVTIVSEEFSYQTDHWLNDITAFLVIAILVVTGWWLLKRLKSRETKSQRTLRKYLKSGLENIVHAHSGTGNADDLVTSCYKLMCNTLVSHGYEKRRFQMTAREYLADLESHGINDRNLDELTTLFEMARYGGLAENSSLQMRAKKCLDNLRENLDA
jgi:hypothetical protein